MNILDETWCDVPGYEGYYQVSSRGRVRSCYREITDRLGRSRIQPGRILVPEIHTTGYLRVGLSRDSYSRGYRVHKLVMLAFVGDRPEGCQVNHKNAAKTDNSLDNLEYCTPKSNAQHAHALGLCSSSNRNRAKGSQQGHSKLAEADIPTIRDRLANGDTQQAIARDYSISQVSISRIKSGKTWKHIL